MDENYSLANGTVALSGHAVYSHFRRFQVVVSTDIKSRRTGATEQVQRNTQSKATGFTATTATFIIQRYPDTSTLRPVDCQQL
jgi:hypothetical protein